MLDRLSPIDVGFLDIEDDVNMMHIGALLTFEGPAPSPIRLRDMVAGKLPSVPRYRQVVHRVPLGAGRPIWVDDPDFDLDAHLHRVEVGCGSVDRLHAVVAELMARRLDRNRPLWELWMLEGLPDDQWAIVAKVHHCLADGVGGVDLLSLILDLDPGAAPAAPSPWRPPPAPDPVQLLIGSLTDLAGKSLRSFGHATRGFRNLHAAVRSAAVLGRVVRPAASSSLNGPIGPQRRWATTSVPVAEVKAIRAGLGASFNDVTLAAVTGGFRALLMKRQESLQPMRTLVPVSVRARDDSGRAVGDGTLANKVSAVFADLPVDTVDPVARLRTISSQMEAVKEAGHAAALHEATSLSHLVPPPVAAAGLHLLGKVPQHNVNTVTTNIPGPAFPLYATGRRMLSAYPYVPIAVQVRTAVAMLSYDGDVHFGITADDASTPDVELIAEGIKVGMDEMLAAVGAPGHGASP